MTAARWTLPLLALAAALPSPAAAALRVRLDGAFLAPGGSIRADVSGARPRSRVVFRALVGGARIEFGRRLADRRGRAAFVLPYALLEPVIAERGLVGPLAAALSARAQGVERSRAITVTGLPPDPLTVAATAPGAVAFDEPLVLRVSGMRPRGPAVEVRFEDCGGTTWPLSVPRGGPTADLALPPGVAPRTAIELTCFAGGQPEYGLPFTVGLVLQDGFQAVSSTGITLLPPRPG